MKIYSYNGKSNICGANVKAFRKQLGISQSDLAARMQVRGIIMEQDVISRIESQERFVPDYELKELAEALGVSMDDLIKQDYGSIP